MICFYSSNHSLGEESSCVFKKEVVQEQLKWCDLVFSDATGTLHPMSL